MNSPVKLKTCKNKGCKEKFPQFNSIQTWCSPKCGQEMAEAKVKKNYKKETIAMRRALNENDKRYQTKKAQDEFNAYIRIRDKDEPCPSCSRYDHEIKEKPTGGKWDCGHFLTVGGYPELRFNELNANRQCKSCNGGSGKYTRKNHTVSKEYRIYMVKKIGLEEVEKLEMYDGPAKLTLEQVREIKIKFRNKRKYLEKQNNVNSLMMDITST